MPWVPWHSVIGHAEGLDMVVFFSESSRRSLGITMSVSTFSEVCCPRQRSCKLAALEREGLGYDAGKGANVVLGDVGNDRCRTGTSATTLACGDEDHVGPASACFDRPALLGSLLANLGVGASAQAALVMSVPMWTLMSASEMASACASVLMATNSTPRMPSSIITVHGVSELPPPPTPTTLITARWLLGPRCHFIVSSSLAAACASALAGAFVLRSCDVFVQLKSAGRA